MAIKLQKETEQRLLQTIDGQRLALAELNDENSALTDEKASSGFQAGPVGPPDRGAALPIR